MIIMVVRAWLLWWSEHGYDDQSIIMVVRPSLWWSEHHCNGGQSIIIMVVRASL